MRFYFWNIGGNPAVQRGGFGKRSNMLSFHRPVMPRGVEVVQELKMSAMFVVNRLTCCLEAIDNVH